MREPRILHMYGNYDAEGSAVVNGRTYRWEFHNTLGVTFLRADGEPLRRQPGEGHPVWQPFGEWLEAYRKEKA